MAFEFQLSIFHHYSRVIITYLLNKARFLCWCLPQGKSYLLWRWFFFLIRCQIAVHQECYGARNVRDFTSWVCKACETPDVTRECCLCPVKGMVYRLSPFLLFWFKQVLHFEQRGCLDNCSFPFTYSEMHFQLILRASCALIILVWVVLLHSRS